MSELDETKTPKTRIADIQIAALSSSFHEFKRDKEKKDAHIMQKIEQIWDKVSQLKCDVHAERMDGMEDLNKERFKSVDKRISWIWIIIVTVIFGGIVFGIWIRGASRESMHNHVTKTLSRFEGDLAYKQTMREFEKWLEDNQEWVKENIHGL